MYIVYVYNTSVQDSTGAPGAQAGFRAVSRYFTCIQDLSASAEFAVYLESQLMLILTW